MTVFKNRISMKKMFLKKSILWAALLCIVLSSGCMNRRPKNYLSAKYPEKEQKVASETRDAESFGTKKKTGFFGIFGGKTDVEKRAEKRERDLKKIRKAAEKDAEKASKEDAKRMKEARKKAEKASREKLSASNYSSPKGTTLASDEPYQYRLKYGDAIVIHLRGIDVKPTEERIDENGYIKLDYIDPVYALGKTTSELESHIEEAYLNQKIYKNLTVSIQTPLKSYFIRGEVLKPGRYSLLGGVSIVQAVATAGGFNDFANPKEVIIIRGGQNIRVNVKDIEKNPAKDVQLEEGDVIVVKRSFL